MQSVSITTEVVSSNPAQARCTRCNIMRQVGRFLRFPPQIRLHGHHDITEIVLKVALNTITPIKVAPHTTRRQVWRGHTPKQRNVVLHVFLYHWVVSGSILKENRVIFQLFVKTR